jgi:uncharacterized membrane protein YfhO
MLLRCALFVALAASMAHVQNSTDWIRWLWNTVQLSHYLLVGDYEKAFTALWNGFSQPNAAGAQTGTTS